MPGVEGAVYAAGVLRRFYVLCIFLISVLVIATPALAQGPIDDAATATATATATPSATPDPPPRPVRGPSVRERGGRRSRGASTASGALMLVILIAFMGYYVVKKLRR